MPQSFGGLNHVDLVVSSGLMSSEPNNKRFLHALEFGCSHRFHSFAQPEKVAVGNFNSKWGNLQGQSSLAFHRSLGVELTNPRGRIGAICH
jgi:hypothetical protein